MPDAAALLQTFQPKEFKILKAAPQVCSARFSPCGKLLAASSHDGVIRRWNSASDDMAELPSLAGHLGWVQEIVFSPANGLMFSADTWGALCAWDYADGGEKPKWSIPAAHNGWIHSLAISCDGSLLATCGMDRAIRVWSSADGVLKGEILSQPDSVQMVAFHPAGELISGDMKGIVRQWDLASGKSMREFHAELLYKEDRLQEVGGVRLLAFDPRGEWLAVGGTKPANGATIQGIPCVLLYDWASGELKHTLELGGANDVYATDIHFHPAGFVMISTCGGPGAGRLVFRVPGEPKPFYEATHMPNCHSLSVHPLGRRLAIACTNAGSNGNGRNLDANGQYPDNHSPIYLLDLPAVS